MTPLMTVEEAAKVLNISPYKLRGLVQCYKIPHKRVGRAIRFSVQDQERYLVECQVEVREPVEREGRIVAGEMRSDAYYRSLRPAQRRA